MFFILVFANNVCGFNLHPLNQYFLHDQDVLSMVIPTSSLSAYFGMRSASG